MKKFRFMFMTHKTFDKPANTITVINYITTKNKQNDNNRNSP